MTIDRDQLILEVLNEVHAASTYVLEFGGITSGSTQAKALRKTLQKLKEASGGKTPVIPMDYPWPGIELGWGPSLPWCDDEGDPPCPSG